MFFPVFLCNLRLSFIKYLVCHNPRLLVPGSPCGHHSGGHKDLETGQVTSRAVPVPGPMADPGTQAATADQAAMADPGTQAAMADPGILAAMAEQEAWEAMADRGA